MCTYISYKSAHKKNDWATQRYIHNHTEINTKQTKERKKKGGRLKKRQIYIIVTGVYTPVCEREEEKEGPQIG